MKRLLVLDNGQSEATFVARFVGQEIAVRRRGCGFDQEELLRAVREGRAEADAIALDALPLTLELGNSVATHGWAPALKEAAETTPLLDGSGLRPSLERWGVVLADRAEPGIFSKKHVLLVPALNHRGMFRALARHTETIRLADPMAYFSIPDVLPGYGANRWPAQLDAFLVDRLTEAEPLRLCFGGTNTHPAPESEDRWYGEASFRWADVIAGDVRAILKLAPQRLKGKTVVVEWADASHLAELQRRSASIVVSLLPTPETSNDSGRGWSAAAIEGLLATARSDPRLPLLEDTYLDLLADLKWTPSITYLQPEEAGVNRFAFVIHPLSVAFIHRHPAFRWTRYLPDPLVERVAAWLPPMYLSRITGGRSPATGQRVEGHLITLGATPREMMRRDERFTYRRLNAAARMAERRGARLMGLGAFTSVVGDAGITVAKESDIAVTSGNSLTVAATLEAAKQAVRLMGTSDLTRGRAMVIGATGSIGSVCARLLAQAIQDVVLVSVEPERLIELKRQILAETPDARVAVATTADHYLVSCDLVVTATSAFGQRVLKISECKPGAVICDVARPADIGEEEAALRPDVLVIESGEVLIPGDIRFGYDIGLPPGTAYACLAETALLAMEGRFEDYTLGRNISTEKAKEIYRLFRKHGFKLAGLRSFGRYVTGDDLAQKRDLAASLRADEAEFERVRQTARERLARIPPRAKGISKQNSSAGRVVAVALGAGLLGYWLGGRIGLRRR